MRKPNFTLRGCSRGHFRKGFPVKPVLGLLRIANPEPGSVLEEVKDMLGFCRSFLIFLAFYGFTWSLHDPLKMFGHYRLVITHNNGIIDPFSKGHVKNIMGS